MYQGVCYPLIIVITTRAPFHGSAAINAIPAQATLVTQRQQIG